MESEAFREVAYFTLFRHSLSIDRIHELDLHHNAFLTRVRINDLHFLCYCENVTWLTEFLEYGCREDDVNGLTVNFRCFMTADCKTMFSIGPPVLLLNMATIVALSAPSFWQFITIYKCCV